MSPSVRIPGLEYLRFKNRTCKLEAFALPLSSSSVIGSGTPQHCHRREHRYRRHHRHVLPLEHLLDALSEVAPDLVQVVVLLGRVRASMGSTRHLEPADDSFVDWELRSGVFQSTLNVRPEMGPKSSLHQLLELPIGNNMTWASAEKVSESF